MLSSIISFQRQKVTDCDLHRIDHCAFFIEKTLIDGIDGSSARVTDAMLIFGMYTSRQGMQASRRTLLGLIYVSVCWTLRLVKKERVHYIDINTCFSS